MYNLSRCSEQGTDSDSGIYSALSINEGVPGCNNSHMRKAIGFVIVLWALSKFFTGSFAALDTAATATLGTIEAAAIQSQLQMTAN